MRWALIIEESRRAVDRQATRLDELQSRTAGILAVATGAVAFLGLDLARGGLRLASAIPAALGAAAYLAVIGLALRVLRPRSGWRFTLTPAGIVDATDAPTPGDLARWFASWMADNHRSNDQLLATLVQSLQQMVALTGIAVVTLLGSIAMKGTP